MAKKLQLINGLPVMTEELAYREPYDVSIYYAYGLEANTEITLPNSGYFDKADASDILVILNDLPKEVSRDFNVVGESAPYTKIKFIYNLPNDSVVRFKKNL